MRSPTRRGSLTGVALVAVLAVIAGCSQEPDSHPSPGPTSSVTPTTTAAAEPDLRRGISSPVADKMYPWLGNPSIDVLYYNLNLIWSPRIGVLSGTATLTVRTVKPRAEISLDFAAGNAVDSASIDEDRAGVKRDKDKLILTPAKPLPADARAKVVIRYHGKPKPVPAPSARADLTDGLGLRVVDDGEACTVQQPYGAFTWYPVNDLTSDEALYDVRVTVPKDWAAVAAGVLISHDVATDGETYLWRSPDPVASYATTLALGRYEMVTDTGPHGLPITYWLRTGRDEAFLAALRRSPQLLTWLEQRFGRYPFGSAGVVLVDSRSAMESQQMITYGVRAGTDPDSPLGAGPPDLSAVEETLLHEYASQWFGDAVTPRDWRAIWLSEGFALYAQWLWSVDSERSSDAAWVAWARDVDARSRAVAGPPGNYRSDRFGENNVSAGPALMLHAIHKRIGDAAFYSLARDWVQTQKGKHVDRAGFVAFVKNHTGRDLTNLINSWLDSAVTPAA